jgi:hypothetical protein
MYQLVLKPRAILITKDAYDWYEAQRLGLGEIFLTELDICYKKIQTNPAANSKVKKNYRQGRLLRFPYVVVYEIKKCYADTAPDRNLPADASPRIRKIGVQLRGRSTKSRQFFSPGDSYL